ncbi:conjugative transposon protein TraM [Parabacteroides johnsonii]|uniref:conjugative transposon protein TraM n=1 Tax=Parabacteroides johnsonii TaxID=387661 RepID=UPI003C6E5DDC
MRLRLLDDIEIQRERGQAWYLPVCHSQRFSSGRVKGSINSILVEDELVKVSLSIYDTDGLKTLTYPSAIPRDKQGCGEQCHVGQA